MKAWRPSGQKAKRRGGGGEKRRRRKGAKTVFIQQDVVYALKENTVIPPTHVHIHVLTLQGRHLPTSLLR